MSVNGKINRCGPMSAFLLSASLLVTAPSVFAQAQDNLKPHGASAANLMSSKAPLGSDNQFGIVRLQLTGTDDPATWDITLDYGGGRVLTLNSTAIASRVVSRDQGQLTIDVPLVPNATLSATSTKSLDVRIVSVMAGSGLHAEQMLDNSKVVPFSQGATATELRFSRSFGRLEVLGADADLIGTCTAFRIANGYWATAAHCVFRQSALKQQMTRWRLQLPGAGGSFPEDASYLEGVPVATGVQAASTDPSTLLSKGDLDYAILKVAGDPGGPSFSLVSHPLPAARTPLELLQYWAGHPSPPPAGYSKASDSGCQVDQTSGQGNDESINCPRMIQHGCSSEDGASGGPLVNRTTFQLEGVHYAAGIEDAFNCAVPAAEIVKDLCLHHSTVAGSVAKCI